ncbi:hypothetical protein [uncultured Muribaculum sp.]|uniref:hypothetical protein n=1 Tax=uncultured Muribaculum sp. TaxID=1918613 RepID=UPI002587E6B0|nr:hypothetical protein [uncultured Muribaculum sp.]
MSKQDIITAIFGKTESGEPYTLKQGLVFVWFAFSLSALCILAEGPYWLLAILFANFWASARALEKLPLPADPEDKFNDDEDD